MRVMTIGALALALSACASAAPGNAPPDFHVTEWTRPLDLTAEGENLEAINATFASRVSSRYGARAEAAGIQRDLTRQGFLCREVPPVEARRDYLVAACEKPRPHGFCSDLFVVSLRYAGAGRRADSLAVRADGSFERSCIAAKSR